MKPFRETITGSARSLMRLLMGAVGFVLLIACGNAANLLLARNASRTHELGVRATLGAERGRLIQQMLTDSLLLGIGGGAAGIGLAWLFLHLLLKLDPGNIPRLREASLNPRVLLFSVALTLLTSVLTGILPAFSSSRIDLVEFLKSGGNRGTVSGNNRLRGLLIVGEVALVVILLSGAGLLIRSFLKVESVPTGFSTATLSMKVELPTRYYLNGQHHAFFQRLLESIRAIPGVQVAGAVNSLPLSHDEGVTTFWVEGYKNEKGQTVEGSDLTPGYFSAMGTPLLKGRTFTESDPTDHPAAAIINEAFAKKYFAGHDAIGKWVRTDQPNDPGHPAAGGMTIVGVVADVRHLSLEQPAEPQLYLPMDDPNGAYIAIRASLPPAQVVTAARSILNRFDPTLNFTDVRTMNDRVSEAMARRKFQTTLLAIFAGVALFLALIGLYGLLAYSVRQRKAEMGIRIAVGASRRRVLQLVIVQGLRLVVVGLTLGLAGAFALTRALSSFLFGIQANDPLTFFLVPLLLFLASFAACAIPGWKAANVDPVRSLRYE